MALTLKLSERQESLLGVLLNYGRSNVYDINDLFANYTDEDPDNEDGNINVNGKVMDSFSDGDIEELAAMLEVAL